MNSETLNTEIYQRLLQGTELLGLDLTSSQTQNLQKLLQLLFQWNKIYNLTAVRDPLEMVGYHILDSLSLLPYVTTGPVLDLGTGAGFPGLPLAILSPDTAFSLLDSNGKKVRFVRQAVMELGLKNVQIIQSRVEMYKNPQIFAIVVARALAPLSQLLNWANPLLKRPGVLLAAKGPGMYTEFTDLTANIDQNLLQVQIHELKVPYVAGQRMLVEIRFS